MFDLHCYLAIVVVKVCKLYIDEWRIILVILKACSRMIFSICGQLNDCIIILSLEISLISFVAFVAITLSYVGIIIVASK